MPALLTPEALHILIYLKFDINKNFEMMMLSTAKKSARSIFVHTPHAELAPKPVLTHGDV